MDLKIYYDDDSNFNYIKDLTIAVIGYGSQGHAHAQNLKDSGLNVIVGQRPGSINYDLAIKHGFTPVSAFEAAQKSQIIMMLVPDQAQPKIYNEEILPNLTEGKMLMFSHGFNIHFGQIVPPNYVDVAMVAPKGPGHLVRREYERGAGVPCLVAIHQDFSGNTLQKALAYAKGIGGTRAGVLETTFKEETETDLFGEQCVLCGGVSELIKAGFETLVNAGYRPEIAYFECCHELKLIVDLIYEGGLSRMRYSISDTAEYGDLTRGKRIITEETRCAMEDILKEIQSGEFAREWILENMANRPVLNARRREEKNHPIEEVGSRLRAMMGWLKK